MTTGPTDRPGPPAPAALAELVGTSATFAKTVGESDVYLFAGITGDLSPNHVDGQAMASTPYGRRIAHGVLLVGFMSTAATRFLDRAGARAVSAGYDRIRFVAPVFIGDTVTVTYTATAADPERRRLLADVVVRNQDGVTCAVATHVLAFLG